MGKEKPTELTYTNLKDMDKSTFAKLFKKPAIWKKAKAVVFLAKYKCTNGKVPLVAVPFKKYTDAAKCFKDEVKKNDNFTAKLTLLAAFEWKKGLDGNLQAIVSPMKGGLNLDYASTYGKELFSKIKVGFDIEGATGEFESEDLKEVSEAAGENLSDKKVTKEVEKKNKRKAKLAKISENLGKFEKAIGRVQLIELQEKLADYKKYLELLTAEANEDGNVDEEEQTEIDRLKNYITTIESSLQESQESTGTPLSSMQREQMFNGLDKMEKYIDKVLKKLEITA